jgi:hypothetical protein
MQTIMIPLPEKPGFVKDPASGSILNTDNTALASYKRQKKLLSGSAQTENRLDRLEKKFEKIEGLLEKVLERLS